MSSVESRFSQPLTRNFVVTQGPNDNHGVYVIPKSSIDVWYEANKAYIAKVGSVYTIPGTASGSTFVDVVNGENGRSRLGDADVYTYDGRKTLKDMGVEVIIGDTDESRRLVLRKIQVFAPVSADGGPTDTNYTGYVVVENDVDELAPSDWGRFTVRVARV